MRYRNYHFITFIFFAFMLLSFGCQKQQQAEKSEVAQEELSWQLSALEELHDVVYPLWHDAFPEKDYAKIKELLPQADSLTVNLEKAQLPGILRDKQEAWDIGKEKLRSSLQKLHQAVDDDNKEEMLAQVEAFHAAYERLVRTIRPVIAEFEAFHQELYKLYHHYLPDYDLENIRLAVAAMGEKLPALREAELPKRLEEKKAEFDQAVQDLGSTLSKLSEVVKKDDKRTIEEAVEEVHTAYQKTEQIFK